MLSVHFSDINCIHSVVQSSPLVFPIHLDYFIPKTFLKNKGNTLLYIKNVKMQSYAF